VEEKYDLTAGEEGFGTEGDEAETDIDEDMTTSPEGEEEI